MTITANRSRGGIALLAMLGSTGLILGVATPATADPKRGVLPLERDELGSLAVVVASSSTSATPGLAVVGTQVGIPYAITLSGTFTPVGGAPEPFLDVYLRRAPAHDRFHHCTFHQEGTNEFGSFVIDGDLLRSARRADAESAFDELGPPATWSTVSSFRPAVDIYGALVAAELGRTAVLEALVRRLSPLSGHHAHGGNAVTYLGPVDLVLGRAALAFGRSEDAVRLLTGAASQAELAGSRPFVAETRRWLAEARAVESDTSRLTERETEIAALVAEGLTNRQIGNGSSSPSAPCRTTSSTSCASSASRPGARSRSGARGPTHARVARRMVDSADVAAGVRFLACRA